MPVLRSVHQKRSDPEFSCVSMKSHRSMDGPVNFRRGDTQPDLRSVRQKRSDQYRCVSMKSHRSMDGPVNFSSGDTQPDLRFPIVPPRTAITESKKIKLEQSEYQPQDMCPGFSHKSDLAEVLNTFKSNLRKKFECLYEGTSQQGNPTLLNEIYTELYITESERGEISNEHEVRQIETQSRRTATEDTPIKCNDIFKPLPEQDKPIRSVLTKGVAGIGKTVSVQKFILDWAEGKENQDVHLIFPLPFREINLMKNKTLSLLDLLHLFFPETKEMEISSGEYKVLFIFDGLDECRVSLDFHSSVKLCDVSESASVDVMLTNLMAGNLLPSSLIWITSRPAAADLIPSECVDRVTEVRGFTDKQKEEYFSKRISDESLNNRIKLNKCGITAEGCVALASALSSKTSCLTDLDLSVNVLQDSGVKLISAGLKNLHCKLKILRLSNCSVTKEGVVALAEALNSNPSHLTELHLQENHLKESDINLLSTIQDKVII